MKVGFVGFGEVASTLSNGLLDSGLTVLTCLHGRSLSTKNKALDMGVNICNSHRELAETSEILISAVTPSTALDVAREMGKYSRGIYVDINNVSPSTVIEAMGLVENKKTVDAAVIGSVKRNGPEVQIIACGDSASDFAVLNDYGLNIKIMGAEIGNCSQIKMLRSSYTKGVSALLWETIGAAYELGIDEEVLEIIGQTEGPQFENSSKSRLLSSFNHSKRRYEEMNELKNLLSGTEYLSMVDAIEKTFEIIYEKNRELNKDQKEKLDFKSYKEIFKALNDIK
jgi:3-hydroxyisobutyrate dehydrogenase-like beta-hydroxyacid dehydrogenase